MVASRWPVVTIWQAHRRGAEVEDRFSPVRAALAAGVAEHALVTRIGWRAQVESLDAGDAAFSIASMRAATLSRALDDAGTAFSFERWLQRALANRWLQAVERIDAPHAAASA